MIGATLAFLSSSQNENVLKQVTLTGKDFVDQIQLKSSGMIENMNSISDS